MVFHALALSRLIYVVEPTSHVRIVNMLARTHHSIGCPPSCTHTHVHTHTFLPPQSTRLCTHTHTQTQVLNHFVCFRMFVHTRSRARACAIQHYPRAPSEQCAGAEHTHVVHFKRYLRVHIQRPYANGPTPPVALRSL